MIGTDIILSDPYAVLSAASLLLVASGCVLILYGRRSSQPGRPRSRGTAMAYRCTVAANVAVWPALTVLFAMVGAWPAVGLFAVCAGLFVAVVFSDRQAAKSHAVTGG